MFPDFVRDDVFRLESSRLWLRWPQAADAKRLAALAGNKAVAEMTARIPHPYQFSDGENFILTARKANSEGARLDLVIACKNRPMELIGGIGLSPARGERVATLGYWLGEPYWGKGFITEAAQALIDLVFGMTGVLEIEAEARVINPASRRVMEKCGFAYVGTGLSEAPARGGPLPCDRFRLDRKAWSSLRSWRVPQVSRGEACAPA
jgi:RimJ/RimL family protein N-acetyltransferase